MWHTSIVVYEREYFFGGNGIQIAEVVSFFLNFLGDDDAGRAQCPNSGLILDVGACAGYFGCLMRVVSKQCSCQLFKRIYCL